MVQHGMKLEGLIINMKTFTWLIESLLNKQIAALVNPPIITPNLPWSS
jgi:hypothetical protein